jgi:hypothetical protein
MYCQPWHVRVFAVRRAIRVIWLVKKINISVRSWKWWDILVRQHIC